MGVNDFTPDVAGFLNGGGQALGNVATTTASAAGSGLMSSLLGGGGMAAGMAGGPIGMVAMSVLGGIQAAQATRDARDVVKVNAENSNLSNAYTLALKDWYNTRDKENTRGALENYKQFNTMDQIAPGYKDVYKPAALQSMPNVTDYLGHRKNKKVNAKAASLDAQGKSTVGTVTVPGG